MYRLKKEPNEGKSNMYRRAFIAIACIAAGFTFGFLFGGGSSDSDSKSTVRDHQRVVNQPPPEEQQPPPEPQLTEEQKNSSVFYDGSYHYNNNTPGVFIYKVVDEKSHTICYTAEPKYGSSSVSISCVKDDTAHD
jgi:hypothetical protein